MKTSQPARRDVRGFTLTELMIVVTIMGAMLAVSSPALMKFALYWDAIGNALSGREMLLIDSDKVAGRRNLMLFDPELFRVPFPVPVPQERPGRSPFRPKDEEP